MTDELTRATQDALLERAEAAEERTIVLRLLRWGEIATHTMEGIKETFSRGAFKGVDASRVTLESQKHGGPLVGVATEILERAEDAIATFRIAKTAAGDELLELARAGVLRDSSIVFAPISHRERPDGVIERSAVDLRRVALLERGAYPSAQLLAVREEAASQGETMDNIEAAVVETVDLTPVMERLESIETKVGTIEAMGAAPAVIKARYNSLADYSELAYRGEADGDLLARALADQITSQNTGMVPEAWLPDVKRIVNLGRRAITAFGGPKALPEKGMTVDYPYLASANTLVAAQSAEKAEITSARVDFTKGSANIVTYAGGSDISYQLIQRSSPSYREAYDRVMLGAWAGVTDAAFVTALEAGTVTKKLHGMVGAPIALAASGHADDIFDTSADHGLVAGDAVVFTTLTGGDATTAALVGRVVWVIPTSLAARTFRVALTPGGAAVAWGTADISAGSVSKLDTTGENFRSSLFEASIAVEDAVGAPAGVVVASTDIFLALAGLSDFVANVPGGSFTDASGLANASTLRMESSGLEIVRSANVTAGKMIVSSPLAASWHEAGPYFATSEDVAKLGQNVAVYSFGAGVVYNPAGVIEVTLI